MNSDKENYLKPTLELLNSKFLSNFDLPKLIEMIPNNWSLELTNEFLQNALRHNLSKKRNFSVEKNIANNYKFNLQTILQGLKKEQLYLDEDSKCFKCHKSFDSSIFAKMPKKAILEKSKKNEKLPIGEILFLFIVETYKTNKL